MLADTDEPTADELTVAGLVLERYTAPVDDEDGTRGSAAWSCCATSPASARSTSSSPT